MAPIVHAFCNDALADHDAVELARRIHIGELQSREVVDAAIARARRVAPVLNPIALESFARAAEATAQPRTGAFAGVPTFLKDTIALSGLPTRYGSLALADIRPARTDDAVARQFLAQGFVVLGKSTLPEMGFNATTEPARPPRRETPGAPSTRRAGRPAAPRPSSHRESCPWPTAMTEGARCGSPPLAAACSRSSHRSDGCP